MKTKIESKIVRFEGSNRSGFTVHHQMLVDSAELIDSDDLGVHEVLDDLIRLGLASVSHTDEGLVVSWYSFLPCATFPVDEVPLDYSLTGNGSSKCYDCGAEFAIDVMATPARVKMYDRIQCFCPDCGGRSAQPMVDFDFATMRDKVVEALKADPEKVYRVAELLGLDFSK